MQPSPSAETSRPLFPSVRFFIFNPPSLASSDYGETRSTGYPDPPDLLFRSQAIRIYPSGRSRLDHFRYEKSSLADSPQAAGVLVADAQRAYPPQITLHAAFEADRQRFTYHCGAGASAKFSQGRLGKPPKD